MWTKYSSISAFCWCLVKKVMKQPQNDDNIVKSKQILLHHFYPLFPNHWIFSRKKIPIAQFCNFPKMARKRPDYRVALEVLISIVTCSKHAISEQCRCYEPSSSILHRNTECSFCVFIVTHAVFPQTLGSLQWLWWSSDT